MDKLPPNINKNSVVNIYIPQFFECQEEHIDIVVITGDGELLEIYNKSVIASSKLCDKIEGFTSVKICYTYGPKIKYYIVLVNERLFAVRKIKALLEPLHLLDDVKQFSIEDKKKLGVPQIVALHLKETVPPTVLNLSHFIGQCNINSSKLISPAAIKLYSHIHALRTQIKKNEKLILEKKALVSRTTSDYMFIAEEESHHLGYEELALVLGKISTKPARTKMFPFCLGEIWVRVCFDRWVIGVYISNLQSRKICDLEWLIMNPNICIENTQFYTNQEKKEPFSLTSDFKKIDFIPGHGHGYVLGVLKEQVFTSSFITFTCNLSFTFEKQRSEQLYIGTIEVLHTDILSSAFVTFHQFKTVPDLLSMFATGLRNDVNLVKLKDVRSSISKLLSNLNFSQINEKYFLANFNSSISFRGILLKVVYKEDSCSISFYSRNIQDVCLYIQHFKQLPCDLLTVKESSLNINNVCLALYNEIMFYCELVKSEVLKNSGRPNEDSSDALVITLDVMKINEIIKREEDTQCHFSMLNKCK